VKPSVVALGGGHGLATALRAIRHYAGTITAVVSVADDGGSSGRLRRELDVEAPGDVRKCLVALAGDDTVWSNALEYRFGGGELDGHALGNLVLVGLAESLGDFSTAIDEVGHLLRTVGRVLPATTEPVVLKADVEGESVEGQVAVAMTGGAIRRVSLVPDDAAAPADALAAISAADQIVLAPGSLYTSLLPVLAVDELRAAIAVSPAQVVQICNLRPQLPETAGLDGVDHLRAVLEHGARVDVFLWEPAGGLAVDTDHVRATGVRPVPAGLAAPSGLVHDPARLAQALHDLLESDPTEKEEEP
jgi:uncharacterized cofD-like protein